VKKRSFTVASFLAACAALIVPEARRYSARIELNRLEDLIRYANADKNTVRKKTALLNARDRLNAVVPRLPNDVRPLYFLGVAAQLHGEARDAIEAFRGSLSVQERPVVDLALSRTYQEMGAPEEAAALALRAVWLAPWLLWQIPKPARGAVRSQIRKLEEDLRGGDASAIPEFPLLDSPPGQDHG
jgi:hypothetical protein